MALNDSILSEIISTSPSVELLRLRNRELVLLFLYRTFYHKPDPVAYEHLCVQLSDYLCAEHLDQDEESGISVFDTYDEKARKYIMRWTDKGFLRNYQEETGEVFYELSSYASKTLDWLLSLKKEDFVGTESKFMNLFSQMKELVEFTNEDKDERIRILEARKQEIEHEIQTIRAGGDARVFEEYQIRPRFRQITQSAKDLLSDFKEVEENFKNITKSIYQKHAEGGYTKGDILGFTFDALEDLQNSPQGRSFYAFWDFLLSPSLQEEWDELVSGLFETLDHKSIQERDQFLRNMKQYLYAAGKKVYQANDKMAEKLSKIICEQEAPKQVAARKLIQDIQATLLELVQKNCKPEVSLSVEMFPEIRMPAERKLTLERNTEVVYRQVLEVAASDITQADYADALFATHTVDRGILKQRVLTALKRKKQVSLAEVIERNGGLEKGLAELFGYIGLLSEFRYHVHTEKTVDVPFNTAENKMIRVPEIIIVR